jgi:two-component system response regulator YesN
MYRLLIVDDMPIITDGLADLFLEHAEGDLEVFRAYTALEALDILHRLKIDVVLTDIKMPGMSGIQLLKEIRSQWPRCKVIFLTSYDEFDFAREAINLGSFDYILKTEGDERILSSVKKALAQIQEELEAEVVSSSNKEQLVQAKHVLQKEYFVQLLEGRCSQQESRQEKFEQLEIPLQWDMPVFLIIMRLDSVKEDINYSGLIRRFYSVQNIMEDGLQDRVLIFPIPYSHYQHIWLLQPMKNYVLNENVWNNIFHFIYGNLETVQNICSSSLKLKVSFVISRRPAMWDQIAEKYLQMEMLLRSGIGLNSEVLTTDEELQKHKERRRLLLDKKEDNQNGFCLTPFYNLVEHLNSGEHAEFFELFEELNRKILDCCEELNVKLDVYHFLSHLFLTYINRWKMFDLIKDQVDISKLMKFDEDRCWKEYEAFFRELAAFLLELQALEREQQTNHLVEEIQEYINNHLDDDLSLTRLGELVHLNPSYLSRLYKQLTGIGLSDYIAQQRIAKAKKLLTESRMKISDITTSVGYNSAIAFTRFFKKAVGVTPQDYRDNFA